MTVNKIHLAAECILDHLPKKSKQLRMEIKAEDSFYQRVDDYARSEAWRRFIGGSVGSCPGGDNTNVLFAGYMTLAFNEGDYVEEFIVLLSVKSDLTWQQIANHFVDACKYD